MNSNQTVLIPDPLIFLEDQLPHPLCLFGHRDTVKVVILILIEYYRVFQTDISSAVFCVFIFAITLLFFVQ